jgi:hypothetical protein
MLDTFSRARFHSRRELTSCTQCGESLVAPNGRSTLMNGALGICGNVRLATIDSKRLSTFGP